MAVQVVARLVCFVYTLIAHGLALQARLVMAASAKETLMHGKEGAVFSPTEEPAAAAMPAISSPVPLGADSPLPVDEAADAAQSSRFREHHFAGSVAEDGNSSLLGKSLARLMQRKGEEHFTGLRGGSRFQRALLNKPTLSLYQGLTLLIFAMMLFQVQLRLSQHPALRAEGAAGDKAFSSASSTLKVASHVLNTQKARSVLVMLLLLPYWKGLAMAGAWRVFVSLGRFSERLSPAAEVAASLNGVVEILLGLTIVFGQEMPVELVSLLFKDERVRSFAPGLLVAQGLIYVVTALCVFVWEKRRLKERHRGRRPVARSAMPPMDAEGASE